MGLEADAQLVEAQLAMVAEAPALGAPAPPSPAQVIPETCPSIIKRPPASAGALARTRRWFTRPQPGTRGSTTDSEQLTENCNESEHT